MVSAFVRDAVVADALMLIRKAIAMAQVPAATAPSSMLQGRGRGCVAVVLDGRLQCAMASIVMLILAVHRANRERHCRRRVGRGCRTRTRQVALQNGLPRWLRDWSR